MAISLLLLDRHYAPRLCTGQPMSGGYGGSGKHRRAMG
jgi:hypothetical protein